MCTNQFTCDKQRTAEANNLLQPLVRPEGLAGLAGLVEILYPWCFALTKYQAGEELKGLGYGAFRPKMAH